MSGQWLKAQRSRYKHLYVGDKALCDSPARPYPPCHLVKHAVVCEHCPKCKAFQGKERGGTVTQGELWGNTSILDLDTGGDL